MKSFFAAFISVFAIAASAAPDFTAGVGAKTEALIKAGFTRSTFKSFDGATISIAHITKAGTLGTVVVSPGRTESITGLMEVISDLWDAGYSVAIIDQRGQGLSDRQEKSSDVGHVENFSDYQRDFAIFVDDHVRGKLPEPFFLLADSMGAAISLDYAMRNPTVFRAVGLAAPLIKITTPIPDSLAIGLAQTMKFFGRGSSFIPQTGPYDPKMKFEGNIFTHSKERFQHDIAMTIAQPMIAVGGPSYSWVLEATRATAGLRARAQDLKTPTVLFQAGADSVVDSEAQDVFCSRAANCRVSKIEGARHWILFEEDTYRAPVFQQLFAFFSESAKASPTKRP